MDANKPNPQIDRIARALATSAGLNWERLDYHPGYLRGIWRMEAVRLMAGLEREACRAA